LLFKSVSRNLIWAHSVQYCILCFSFKRSLPFGRSWGQLEWWPRDQL
jgi:hypothetical protein